MALRQGEKIQTNFLESSLKATAGEKRGEGKGRSFIDNPNEGGGEKLGCDQILNLG